MVSTQCLLCVCVCVMVHLCELTCGLHYSHLIASLQRKEGLKKELKCGPMDS